MTDTDGEQPRCPKCGVLMRDIDGGWRCPACGHEITPTMAVRVPRFVGPTIRGG